MYTLGNVDHQVEPLLNHSCQGCFVLIDVSRVFTVEARNGIAAPVSGCKLPNRNCWGARLESPDPFSGDLLDVRINVQCLIFKGCDSFSLDPSILRVAATFLFLHLIFLGGLLLICSSF